MALDEDEGLEDTGTAPEETAIDEVPELEGLGGEEEGDQPPRDGSGWARMRQELKAAREEATNLRDMAASFPQLKATVDYIRSRPDVMAILEKRNETAETGDDIDPEEVAREFIEKPGQTITGLLKTIAALGAKIEALESGRNQEKQVAAVERANQQWEDTLDKHMAKLGLDPENDKQRAVLTNYMTGVAAQRNAARQPIRSFDEGHAILEEFVKTTGLRGTRNAGTAGTPAKPRPRPPASITTSGVPTSTRKEASEERKKMLRDPDARQASAVAYLKQNS